MAAYRVVSSQAQHRQFLELIQSNPHRRDDILNTTRAIFTALETSPLEVGDPVYRLHHLGLLVCVVAQRPIAVYYGVDEVRKLVYLKSIVLMSESGA